VSKRLGFAALSASLALTLAACGGEGAGGSGGAGGGGEAEDLTIGVSMPTQTSERWIADGDNVKEQLEERGYTVDLQYANDDIPTQSQQIDSMITAGVDALIIAAIDGTALSSQLQAAAAADIPVDLLRPAHPRQRERRLLRHRSTTTRSACRRPTPC
jgi:putative multiple sugar transport system substrate-binding protein